jgi:peptide/nickel transport system permease protein
MKGYLLRRLLFAAVVVWVVVSATFLLAQVVPADPARAAVGPHADAQTIARARARLCLDRPLYTQYGCFVVHALRGDLGTSFRTGRPVATLLAARAWPTLQLALGAILLELLLGVPLGLFWAWRRGRPDAAALDGLSSLGLSAPAFVIGPLLIYCFAYRFELFPISGYGAGGLDRLRHLVLPALTLAAAGAAYTASLVRTELLAAMDEPYLRTARAKGLGELATLCRHALPNALGPLFSMIGLRLGELLGGAILIESIFGWPGLGREALTAILSLDLPVILGITLVGAIAVVLVNLLADLAHAFWDPRVRLKSSDS